MHDIIETMALDLGVYHFANEALDDYQSRVIYSGLASWIKAITMDQSVSFFSSDAGVSRRYVHERCKEILLTLLKMYPESKSWFIGDGRNYVEETVGLIRNRLLKHGDLLNKGFSTNIVLSYVNTKQITSEFETVYGIILSNDIEYDGVAAIRKINNPFSNSYEEVNFVDPLTWLSDYLCNLTWFSSVVSKSSKIEYFDPFVKLKNNNSVWKTSLPNVVEDICLAKVPLGNHNFEFYLYKPKIDLWHKIDPFFVTQGYHIRIKNALRVAVNNIIEVKVEKYASHVKLQLNELLPEEINVLLESYAWPCRYIKDRYRWVMTPFIWRYLTNYIENVGVRITEITHG
ncbi:hypothetical protein [Succinimonas sp.]|uniref:hypothetical protein n=1 Tax=Succinimonas sp. TaxID=1936151 RepID=UPI00386AA41B